MPWRSAVMTPDFELQSAIIERIRRDERMAPTEIGVAVHDGIVTLDGEVDSLAKRSAAAGDTEKVPAVIWDAVENRIEIVP
jgi:osmotically-inducible protein OsmY